MSSRKAKEGLTITTAAARTQADVSSFLVGAVVVADHFPNHAANILAELLGREGGIPLRVGLLEVTHFEVVKVKIRSKDVTPSATLQSLLDLFRQKFTFA